MVLSEDSILITNGDSSAEIDILGAHVNNLVLKGKEILKPSGDGKETHGGMALMVPFANRVRNAVYNWNGKEYHLPKNNNPHSIHGLTRNSDWNVNHRGNDTVSMSHKLFSEGYPVPLFLKVTYGISETSFSITIDADNEGDSDAPYMAGIHPYFLFEDNWKLKGARNLLELEYGDSYFPNGKIRARKSSSIGSGSNRQYDNTFISHGTVTMVSKGSEIRISNREMPYLVIYNGEYSEGRSVALEPMTGAPDSFNNGIGLISIPSGASFQCRAVFELIK